MESETGNDNYAENMEEGNIAMDTTHYRLKHPEATCLDCNRLVKKKDLGNHRVKKCMEGCGEGCTAHRCETRYKGKCESCGGYVYPFLSGIEIQFSHSCNQPVRRRGCKFICSVCSKSYDSLKEFKQHVKKVPCPNKCSQCHLPMFEKQSVFGTQVKHVCHAV